MRKRFGDLLRVGVSAGGVALVRTRRWGSAAPEALGELACPPDAGAEMIGATLRALIDEAGVAGWPASIVLADELTRVWQVTPPQGSTRLADLQAAAALRFQTLYGDSAAGWDIAAGWDAKAPFLAAAMPHALRQHLDAACGGAVAMVPQFVAGFNQWRGALRDGAWYGQVHGTVLTVAALEEGSVRAVRAQAVPANAGANWLNEHLAREALRLNLGAPARLMVAGQVPQAWQAHCGVLGTDDPKWSAGMRLAVTGSAA